MHNIQNISLKMHINTLIQKNPLYIYAKALDKRGHNGV